MKLDKWKVLDLKQWLEDTHQKQAFSWGVDDKRAAPAVKVTTETALALVQDWLDNHKEP